MSERELNKNETCLHDVKKKKESESCLQTSAVLKRLRTKPFKLRVSVHLTLNYIFIKRSIMNSEILCILCITIIL